MLTCWVISRARLHVRDELTFGPNSTNHLLFVQHLIPPPVYLVPIILNSDDDLNPISIQRHVCGQAMSLVLILSVKV